MMKLTITLCLTIAVLLGTTAHAETVLYCQSELATGLLKENGRWRTGKFVKERFTIKFNSDYTKLYGLDKNRPFNCNVPFSFIPDSIACVSGYGNGEAFLFDKEKLRFLFSNIAITGFVGDGSSTENLYAGNCKKF